MGRGDKKTKRGKIASGSFGVVRPARTKAHQSAQAEPKAEEGEKPARKTRAKKSAE